MPTILIQNRSGASGKIYNVFSEQPGVSGGGVQATRPVVWYQTNPIANNAQAVFRFAPDVYGFVGSTNQPSSQLPDGDDVYLQGAQVLRVGTILNDGTRLMVDKSLNITAVDNTAPNHTVDILTKTEVQSANRNVVGIARLQEGESMPAPVAVVELKPGVDFSFTPKYGVFISSTQYSQGTIQGLAQHSAKVEFTGAQKTAVVVEKSDGQFSVDYK
ncbi:hypothetical protein VTO42DRAFT_2283 [Malbranchea cinnamomea]